MLAQYARKTVTGTGGVSWLDGIHCEIPRIVVRGAATQKRYSGKNLFDIGSFAGVLDRAGNVHDSQFVEGALRIGSGAYAENLFIKTSPVSVAAGYAVTISADATFSDEDLPDNTQFAIGFWSAEANAAVKLGYRRPPFGVRTRFSFSFTPTSPFEVYAMLQPVGDARKRDDINFFVENIQIEVGAAATDYEPYTGGAPAPNPNYPILPQFTGEVTLTDAEGGTVTIPELFAIPGTTVCDTAEYLGGESWRITRRVRAIDSYAGEAVGDVWCSSTGELSEGAAVWYELETPTTETRTLGRLVQPKGAGSIEQTTGDLECEIAVEYVGHS